MTKLSVNVNKIATLRNARGKNNPDVLQVARDIISYGAQGITVHPRPDGRHIRREDVYAIAEYIRSCLKNRDFAFSQGAGISSSAVYTPVNEQRRNSCNAGSMQKNIFDVEFNIEGYPDKDYLDLVKAIKPTQCTLVPDPPEVLTSNAGWQIAKNFTFLKEIVGELRSEGMRTSLFIDPHQITDNEIAQLEAIQTDRIELYTESFAEAFNTPQQSQILAIYQQVANKVTALGIELNAGHDLNLMNLPALIRAIPTIKEVSIGHALICDALYLGLQETVSRYKQCLIGGSENGE